MEIIVVNLSEFCGGLVDVGVGLVIDYDRLVVDFFCTLKTYITFSKALTTPFRHNSDRMIDNFDFSITGLVKKASFNIIIP